MHVVARGVPDRSASVSPTIVPLVETGLSEGLRDGDYKVVAIALKRLGVYLSLKGTLSLDQRARIINLLLKIVRMERETMQGQIKVFISLKKLLDRRRLGLAVKLELDWKELLVIMEDVHCSVGPEKGGPVVMTSHAAALADVARMSRKFLTEDAIEEVVDTAGKYFEDPMSVDIFMGQAVLLLFLPSVESRKYSKHMRHWVFDVWPMVENSQDWDVGWLQIVRRCLKWGGVNNCLGSDPVLLAELFRRVQLSLALPTPSGFKVPARTQKPAYLSPFIARKSSQSVGAKIAIALMGCFSAKDYYTTKVGNIDTAADLLTPNSKDEIASCLEQDEGFSAGFLYLRRLLSSIQTLFHPSNADRNTPNIGVFAESLCRSFVKRLGREKVSIRDGGQVLSVQDKRAFVLGTLPLLEMGMYSKLRPMTQFAQISITHLAYVAPITVSNHFLTVISESLDPNNLNQTHQAPAAIKMLTSLLQPLLQVRPLLASSLPELLELTLPGLDLNDVSKTITTALLYQVVLSWVPIVDVEREGLDYPSDAEALSQTEEILRESYGIDDPAEEEQTQDFAPMKDSMWRGNAIIVEWSLACLERILKFIDNQVKRAKGGFAAQLDNAVFSSIAVTGRLLLAQMSPSVRARAGERINKWALGSVNLDALRESKALIQSYAASYVAGEDGEAIAEVLLVGLVEPLLSRALDKEISSRKFQWSLVLLGGIARVSGKYMLQYETQIVQVVKKALEHEDSEVRKLGGKLLRRSMRGLSEFYIASRASTSVFKNDKDKNGYTVAAVSWAKPESWRETCENVKWHVPSRDELEMAIRLKDEFLPQALKALQNHISASDGSNSFRKTFEIIFQVLRGSAVFETERSAREELLRTFGNALGWLLENRESDTVSHRRVIKCMRVLWTCYGASSSSEKKLKSRKLWFNYMRETLQSFAFESRIRAECTEDIVKDRKDWVVPRYHQLDAVQTLFSLQKHQVAFEVARSDKDDRREDALRSTFDAFMQANEFDWDDTRKAAAEGIKDLMSRAPWEAKFRVNSIIDGLRERKSHGRLMGSGSLLLWPKIIRWITRDWNLLNNCMRAVVLDPDISKLPDDKQKAASKGLQGLTVAVLQAWSRIPLDAESDKLRVSLMEDVTFRHGDKLAWRSQLASCILVQTLVQPQENALDQKVLDWVAECAMSDVLPLRSTAVPVLISLIASLPKDAQADAAGALKLNKSFFHAMADTIAQNHSIANVSVDGNAKGMKQRSEWSAGVGELQRLAKFPGSKFYPRSNMPVFSKNIVTSHILMIKAFAEALGPKVTIKYFLPELDELVLEDTGAAEHLSRFCAGAEIFSGLAAASGNKIDEPLFELAVRGFNQASLESAEVWLDAFRIVGGNIDYLERFAERLREVMQGRGEVEKSVTAANMLRMIRMLVYEAEPSPKLGEVCASVSTVLRQSFGHAYETVRRELGRAFAALLEVCMLRNLEMKWPGPAFDDLAASVTRKPREKESSNVSRSFESAMHIAASLVMCGGEAANSYLIEVVPLIIDAQGHPNAEVSKKAKSAAGCLASVSFRNGSTILEISRAISESPLLEDNWYARSAVVQLLGSIITMNICSLGYTVAAVHLRKEIEKLLRDNQAEVQTNANAMLTSVLSGYEKDSVSLQITVDRYLKLAKTRLSRDQYKTDERKEGLKKRMTGVLGLSALANAFPYTIPFPSAVVALARRVNDSAGVGNAAKKAIKDFKHTHADTWEKSKHVFSTEELEDLQDTSSSGSHA